MCAFVEELMQDMNGDLDRLDAEVDRLVQSMEEAVELRNQSDPLLASLDQFRERYLSSAAAAAALASAAK